MYFFFFSFFFLVDVAITGPVPLIVPPDCHYHLSRLVARGHSEIIFGVDPRECGYTTQTTSVCLHTSHLRKISTCCGITVPHLASSAGLSVGRTALLFLDWIGFLKALHVRPADAVMADEANSPSPSCERSGCLPWSAITNNLHAPRLVNRWGRANGTIMFVPRYELDTKVHNGHGRFSAASSLSCSPCVRKYVGRPRQCSTIVAKQTFACTGWSTVYRLQGSWC